MNETQGEEIVRRGRGLFGPRRAEIERLLNDRELLLRETQGRLHAAEERISELERELDETRDHLANASSSPAPPPLGIEPAPPEPAMPQPATSVAATFVHDELGSILAAAEKAARRIVERAESEAVEEVAAARHIWDDLRLQVSRYAAWRSRAEPAIEAAQKRVMDVQRRSLEVADKARESMRLLTESLGSMDSDLRDIGALPSPPELETPSVFERALAGESEGAPALEAENIGKDVQETT